MTKIAVFVGSLQKNSVNKTLAKNLEAVAPEGVEFDYVDIASLPLFNQDHEAEFPAAAQAMKDIVEAADGVLLITPEYNRSVPGVLKNAIDWTSRPWGQNSFAGKPAGIVGASIAPTGTAAAQAELRNIASYLGLHVQVQPELYINAAATFDESGEVTAESRQYLEGYMESLVAHIDAHAAVPVAA